MKPEKILKFDGMTVAELIDALKTLDPNKPVWLPDYIEETMVDVERIIEDDDAVHISPAEPEGGAYDGDVDPVETLATAPAETITIEELRGSRCDCNSPDCSGAIYIRPSCHPAAGSWTSYDDEQRCLQIECIECGKVVLRILLTKRSHDDTDSRN